jgi:type I restriction enzyme R subunit
MVVCSSRAHAVRYFLAMKDYCAKNGYADVKPLVAFSGTVSYQGQDYTEPQLNSTEELKISESALPMYFASDMFNVLIVAEKYQTGFDEPLLHSMFVDKGLRGVKAVQTLSRLNRCCKGKVDTFVHGKIETTAHGKKDETTYNSTNTETRNLVDEYLELKIRQGNIGLTKSTELVISEMNLRRDWDNMVNEWIKDFIYSYCIL